MLQERDTWVSCEESSVSVAKNERKPWKNGRRKWTLSLGRKIVLALPSPDTEGGTKKSERERKSSYEECADASYPSLLGTSFSFPSSEETFGEIKLLEREASDKEKGIGKQKRRKVTYNMGRMSAALSESTQYLQPGKGMRSSPCQKN